MPTVNSFYVEASAGSGKTSLIISRCNELVKLGEAPESIMCITYTTSAASEIMQRCQLKIKSNTVHSFCGQILTKFANRALGPILDEATLVDYVNSSYAKTLKRIRNIDNNLFDFVIKNAPYYSSPALANMAKAKISRQQFDSTTKLLSSLKNIKSQCLQQSSEYCHIMQSLQFLLIFQEEYENTKKTSGAIDYDDLLTQTHNFFNSSEGTAALCALSKNLKHILIDEAQDLSVEEWKIIMDIIGTLFDSGEIERRSVVIVGDPKQSIFGFQGASPSLFKENIKKIKDKFNQSNIEFDRISLSTSYRVPSNILERIDNLFNTKHWSKCIGAGEKLQHTSNTMYRGFVESISIPQIKKNIQTYDPRIAINSVGEAIYDCIKSLIQSGRYLESTGKKITWGDIMVLFDTRNEVYSYLVTKMTNEKISLFVDRCGYLPMFLLLHEFKWIICSILGQQPNLVAIRQTSIFQTFSNKNRKCNAKEFLSHIQSMSSKKPRAIDLAKIIFNICIQLDRDDEEILRCSLPYLAWLCSQVEGITNTMEATSKWEVEVSSMQSNCLSEIHKKHYQTSAKIMTVHSSKGLGSPVIILYTNWRKHQAPNFIMDDQSGIISIKSSGLKNYQPAQNLINKIISDQEEEQKRLIYVALTRTKEVLLLVGDSWSI